MAVDEERRRLEAIAFGGSASDAEVRAARVALTGLEARGTSTASVASPGPVASPASVAPVAAPAPVAPVASPDPAHAAPPAEATPSPRPAPRLQAGWRARLRNRSVLLPAVIAVTALAAFGAGTAVGAVRAGGQVGAAGSARDSDDGALTLSQLMAMPQTFADQLPGAVVAPVVLHSTRLVYSNKSLSADDSQTPWDVYAGTGTGTDTICLVATADGATSSQSCFPRVDALRGTAVLVAQSRSGTLTVRVQDGVVHGRVTPPT